MKKFLDKALDVIVPVIVLLNLVFEIVTTNDTFVSSVILGLLIYSLIWISFIKGLKLLIMTKTKIKIELFNIIFSIINLVIFILLANFTNIYTILICSMSVIIIGYYIYQSVLKKTKSE